MGRMLLSNFYQLLRLREQQNSWRYGGAKGNGFAAKRLVAKFRSKGKASGRVPSKASKKHASYKKVQRKVKTNFAKAQTAFDRAVPQTLSRRNRVLLINFLDLVLEQERFVVPSVQAIVRFDSVDWSTLVDLQKTWQKSGSESVLFASFLLNVWDVFDGKGGTVSKFSPILSCEQNDGQRYVSQDWWDHLAAEMGVECQDWFDPFPAGCTWKDALTYDWWGKAYVNPPWKLWPKVWKHTKLQIQEGNVDELLMVIPNSAWNGWGNIGSPSAWCQEVNSFERKTVKRVLYAFNKPDGTRYKTTANVICVHLKV